MLYHGSRTPDLTTLTPAPHNGVGGEAVVFATPDIRFALAMIHGTGNEIAVGYTVDTMTGEETMYIDELTEGALSLLNAPGTLYAVEEGEFTTDPRLSHVERIARTTVPVTSITPVPNVLEVLRKCEIDIVPYKDVPEAMRRRGLDPDAPTTPHSADRFQGTSQTK